MHLNGIINAHKRSLKQLIHESELELSIRLMVPRVTTGVNILYGDPSRETSKAGPIKGPYKCLWYDALSIGLSSRGMEPAVAQLVGHYREADSFAELWLDDVLVNKNDIFGLTWFDKAQVVLFNGKVFDFLGAASLGLATTAPYIIMVALKGAVGDVN